MRNNIIRLIALFVSVFLVMLLFSGCGQTSKNGNTSNQTTASSAADSITGQEKNNTLIVDKPLTLTYYVANSARGQVQDYNEILAYKEMEKKTGIHIEFQHPVANTLEERVEQFNLMLASGEYPDIISVAWSEMKQTPEQLIDDNVIIGLNELIDQYAPNYKKILDSNSDIRRGAVTDKGRHFAFKNVYNHESTAVWFGPIIRKDWLDNLSMDVPVTIDEWYTVLQAFKSKDPNGNNKADEIPLLIGAFGDPLGSFRLGRAFIGAWGIAMEYYQDNGTVKYGPLQPEFKEFLKVMNKWYIDGLIDRDYAAMKTELLVANVTNNLLGSLTAGASGAIGRYTNMMKDKDSKFKLVGTPYPVLKAGDKPQLGQRDSMVLNIGAAITTKCKNKIEAVKWLDYAYSEDGNMLMNFGVEGTTYTMVDGYPKYTDLILKPRDISVDENQVKYCPTNMGGPYTLDYRSYEQLISLPEQKDAIKIWAATDTSKLIPDNVVISPEDLAKNATRETDIKTYMDEMINKFIMGVEPIENYDKFVEKIKTLEINSLIAAKQKALDNYNKR
ncbi:MAG TPA: extracellular solute-binding protein [Clostridiales bacterium]|nr:extracellular solute-binding protein [Clostridiales bacterium]